MASSAGLPRVAAMPPNHTPIRSPTVNTSAKVTPTVSPLASPTSQDPKSTNFSPTSHTRTQLLSPSSRPSFSPTSQHSAAGPGSSSPTSSGLSSTSATSSFEQLLFDRPLSAADVAYVRELTSYSMSRLEREPTLLQDKQSEIQRSIEQLAVSNYRTFVDTAEAVHAAHQSVVELEAGLGLLEAELPRFSTRCSEFVQRSSNIRQQQQLNRLMIDNQVALLELLEIPQLMDTCVRSALFDEALDLYHYATALVRRHPNLGIIADILHEMTTTKKQMETSLLNLLSTHIQLSQCLKIVSYLRRLDGYDEATLRQQFLTCREQYLHTLQSSIAGGSGSSGGVVGGYDYLSKFLDGQRVHLFDIVTQYRAIFVDDTVAADEERSDDGGLLYRWIHHRVSILLDTLGKHLPTITEGSHIYSLIEHCSYCGASLARIGIDFRPMLPPLFEQCVMRMFTQSMDGCVEALLAGMSEYGWWMSSRELVRMGLPMDKSGALMSYPPLILAANVMIAAFNRLRHCALLSIAAAISAHTERVLFDLIAALRNYALTYERRALASKDDWEGERDALTVLARGFNDHLLPYAASLIATVYGEEAAGADGGLDMAKLTAALAPLYEDDERERRKREEERKRREEERRKDEERKLRVQEKQEREREEKRAAEEERKRAEELQVVAAEQNGVDANGETHDASHDAGVAQSADI